VAKRIVNFNKNKNEIDSAAKMKTGQNSTDYQFGREFDKIQGASTVWFS